MNQNQGGNDARHDDDSALSDFSLPLWTTLRLYQMNWWSII
ncbi:hypothetical protein CK203_108478 [Vitis vinifera]|uniref:Uncharacterized protein n=1 Tax=Vitis vinifera TaxID=29760 RepID=A0A438E8P6_VITVI|nr:hypothetical protein CK203_108478 [Vitis vinifera]